MSSCDQMAFTRKCHRYAPHCYIQLPSLCAVEEAGGDAFPLAFFARTTSATRKESRCVVEGLLTRKYLSWSFHARAWVSLITHLLVSRARFVEIVETMGERRACCVAVGGMGNGVGKQAPF